MDAGLDPDGTADSDSGGGTGACSDREAEALLGPERLRRGEAVLRARTSRVLLVLEQCHDSLNHQVARQT